MQRSCVLQFVRALLNELSWCLQFVRAFLLNYTWSTVVKQHRGTLQQFSQCRAQLGVQVGGPSALEVQFEGPSGVRIGGPSALEVQFGRLKGTWRPPSGTWRVQKSPKSLQVESKRRPRAPKLDPKGAQETPSCHKMVSKSQKVESARRPGGLRKPC